MKPLPTLVKTPEVRKRSISTVLLWDLLVPISFYFVCFAALTWPLLRSFSTRFFADGWDGRQTLWGIWWVDRAVLSGQSPWHTFFLHFPYGVSLLPHNLSPFNGFIGIVLLRFLTLLQAHNVVVTIGFVVGGFTAFLLCKHVTGAYWPSMAGGAIFTFSNYHFAHAQGHLELVSLEWLPLFVLLWCMLLEKPTVKRGIAAGIGLFLVLLCDYYYFLYSVITGALMLGWLAWQQRKALRAMIAGRAVPLAAFALTALITCGPLIFGLMLLSARDPLLGAHPESEFSMDLLSLWIPGGHWRFAHLTEFYWGQLPGNINESSVNIGISVALLLVYAWFNRPRFGRGKLSAWYLVGGTFAVLALGPTLHVWGRMWPVPLPYRLLGIVIPPLKLTGVPVRMAIMAALSAAVIAAYALKLLLEGSTSRKAAAGAILALLIVEYLPAPIPQTPPDVPPYVTDLARRQGAGAVLDLAAQPPVALYYQTLYNKPLVFGYIARVPQSVAKKDAAMEILIAGQRYDTLCHDYGIQYVVKPDAEVLDLASDGPCTYKAEALANLDKIIDSVSVHLAEGNFVKGSGPALYIYTRGTKRLFGDMKSFEQYGGKEDFSNLIVTSDAQLETIPDGRSIDDEITDPVNVLPRQALEFFRKEVRRWTGFHGHLIKL